MNEGDPGAKAPIITTVIGESGAKYSSIHIEDSVRGGGADQLVNDHEPQPVTLAEGE